MANVLAFMILRAWPTARPAVRAVTLTVPKLMIHRRHSLYFCFIAVLGAEAGTGKACRVFGSRQELAVGLYYPCPLSDGLICQCDQFFVALGVVAGTLAGHAVQTVRR